MLCLADLERLGASFNVNNRISKRLIKGVLILPSGESIPCIVRLNLYRLPVIYNVDTKCLNTYKEFLHDSVDRKFRFYWFTKLRSVTNFATLGFFMYSIVLLAKIVVYNYGSFTFYAFILSLMSAYLHVTADEFISKVADMIEEKLTKS